MNELNKKLLKVERLAKGTKLQRLLAHPARYIYGMLFSKAIYPLQKKGVWANAETFFGSNMQVVLPAGLDIYLTKGKTHDSEIRLAKFMLMNLNEGDTYLDIGAHFGYFSLLAAKIVGKKGKVFSYEASKSTYEVLSKNTSSFQNIKVFHQAISNEETTLRFFEFPVLFSEYNSLDVAQFENEKWFKKYPPQHIDVKATTLSNIVKENSLLPKIIKIDVEGAENTAIEGAKELLQTQQPMIVMEYLANERHNENHRAATQLLINAHFFPHIINDEGKLEDCSDIENFLAQKKLDSDNIVFVKK